MKSHQVKTLLGLEFRIVKRGLAEEQVVALFTDLVRQRDSLLSRQQHINSLQILAEKMVTEATELAEQIKGDAQSKVNRITDEAEKKARKIISETKKQAQMETQEEVGRILQKAREEAAAIIEVTQNQVSANIEEIRERVMRGLESPMGDIVTIRKEGGRSTKGSRKEGDMGSLLLPVSVDSVSNQSGQKSDLVKADFESSSMVISGMMKQVDKQPAAIGPVEKSITLSRPIKDTPVFRGETKIAVVPPVDTIQFKRLRRKLEEVSYFKILRTDGCWDEGYIITARIYKPLPVLSILEGMAEVEKVQLWTGGDKKSDGYFPGWLALEPRPGGLKGDRLVVKLRANFK